MSLAYRPVCYEVSEMQDTSVCEKRLDFLLRERLARLSIAEMEAAGEAVPILAIRIFQAEQNLRLNHEGRCPVCRLEVA